MFIIIKGAFIGRVFNGEIVCDKVWDNDWKGRCYPREYCVKLP